MSTTLRSPRRRQEPEDADQVIVQTDFGKGIVVRTRKSDGIKEIRLFTDGESITSSSSRAVGNRGEPNMLYTPKDYPSVPACVGDDVICQYGRGILKEISSDSTNYTIELSSWRLSGRSNVTCHVTTPPKVVRKHSLSEMDATERVSLAKSLKAQAANYFADKDYDSALNTYASAVDKVRNVQHDHTSTNEVRADLVVIMITCSNNAATCCIKLQKWEEASKFAKNALILLDALYGKRGMKIHTILNQEGIIDGKLFGEWRVKSYLVVARACMEQGEVGDAIVILKKARTMGMQFIQELNSSEQCSRKEEKSSLRSLTSQMKEIKRLLEEYTEKKKAAKKIEKKKAKVMAQALFGDGSRKEEKSSLRSLTSQMKEIKRLLEEYTEKKKAAKKIEKKKAKVMAQALFGDGKENSTPNDEIEMKDKKKFSEGKQPIVEDKSRENASDEHTNSNGGGTATTKKLPFVRKSSLKSKLKREYPPVQQSVSFSDQPPQVKEFERANDDEDESPWYSEHKEALIMLGIAGFSVVAFVGLRRALR
ncbi:hypothetical protein ACHAWC_008637 [Mediolabrus comicus]